MTTPNPTQEVLENAGLSVKPLKASQIKDRRGATQTKAAKQENMNKVNKIYEGVKGPRMSLMSRRVEGSPDEWIDEKGNRFKVLQTAKGPRVVPLNYQSLFEQRYKSEYKDEWVRYLAMVKSLSGTKEEQIATITDYAEQTNSRIKDVQTREFIAQTIRNKLTALQNKGVTVKRVDKAELMAKEEAQREKDKKETDQAIYSMKLVIEQASRGQMAKSLVVRTSKRNGQRIVLPVRHSTKEAAAIKRGGTVIEDSEVARAFRDLKGETNMET